MSKSEKRKLLINAASNWVGFAAQLVAAFLLSPILVHGLGTARYGIWSLVESILAYLLLFDLGVAASVVRYVARFEAIRDRHQLNRIFSTSICIFAVAGMVAGGLAVTLAFAGIELLNIPAEILPEARWMLALLGLNLAVGLPLSVFPSVLDGLERFPVKTAIRTAGLVVRSLLFLLVIRTHGGLIELAWVITGCTIVEHVALAAAAWYVLPGLRFSISLADRETFRQIRGYSLDAFLAMVAGRVSFQTNAIVISIFLAPQFITFFAVAARLVEYAKNSLRALTTVLTPAVSALEAQGDTAAIRRVLVHTTRYVLWLIVPIEVGLLVLGKPFLARWIDPDFAERSYPTLLILSLPLALAISQSVSARILYGIGRLRWFSRLVVIEAVANLLLSIALVGPLGIEGVALGTLIPNALVNCAVVVYVCGSLHVSVAYYLRRAFAAPLLLGGLLAATWLLVGIPAARWSALITTGSLGLAVYAALVVAAEIGPKRLLALLVLWTRRFPRACEKKGSDPLEAAQFPDHSRGSDPFFSQAPSHLPPKPAQVGSLMIPKEAE